jgi:hypothetical protein
MTGSLSVEYTDFFVSPICRSSLKTELNVPMVHQEKEWMPSGSPSHAYADLISGAWLSDPIFDWRKF